MNGDASESPQVPPTAEAPREMTATSQMIHADEHAATHEAVAAPPQAPVLNEPTASAIAAPHGGVDAPHGAATEVPAEAAAGLATISAVVEPAATAVASHATSNLPELGSLPEAGDSSTGARRIKIGSQRDATQPAPQAPRHRIGGPPQGGEKQRGQRPDGKRPDGQRHDGPRHGGRPGGGPPGRSADRPPVGHTLPGGAAAHVEGTESQTTGDAALGERPGDTGGPAGPGRSHEGGRKPRRERGPAAPSFEKPQFTAPKPTRQDAAEIEEELQAELQGVALDQMMSAAPPRDAGGMLAPETRLEGRIVAIHQDNVFVDLGTQHQGLLQLKQFVEPPAVGDVVNVVVNRFDADEGLYQLNKTDAAISGVADWSHLSEGMTVEARVVGHNKGGLECEVGSIRAFMPASHASLYRVEDLSTMVGEKFAVLVTEVNPARRRLIVSRRAVLEHEKQSAREKLRAEIQPGQVRDGVVRSIMDFGAFIDLGGVDGLAHVSQLSWQRVTHPSVVLQVGQQVRVRITKVSAETGKISLSLKDLIENPWTTASSKYVPQSKVTGTVSRIAEFGAFVQLEPGVEGLVHISELAHHRVFRVSDVVQEGQTVECQVLSVDPENQRISLSIRALTPRPESARPRREEAEPEPLPDHKRPVSKKPLKGGVGKSTGGEAFGLRW
ncbi:MAG: S1 RNA-binding domain-containing protein [Pirellulales bacterium]|nr:S1 RNA-binding domain-containing protein [Pirellulales bacterium]